MLWMTYLLSTIISSHSLKVAAMLYVATNPAFGVWSVVGLETPLFACLFVSAIRFHFREEARSLRIDSWGFHEQGSSETHDVHIKEND